jgi:hypothetical protein
MVKKHKQQILILLACTIFLTSALISGKTFAATSTITITSTPFLSFNDIPDSFQIGSLTVPTVNTSLYSDSDGINLPASRHLTIKDSRKCGGLNLQLQADTFLPFQTPDLRNTLRVVTTTADQLQGTVVNNVEYLEGFSGDQAIIAPLEAGSTNFGKASTFTSLNNTLNTPIDLLQGKLNAPAGRDGEIHISVSFYLEIPKLYIPNSYHTTLTYTLSDDTIGTCNYNQT